jgi:hypothetical protein
MKLSKSMWRPWRGTRGGYSQDIANHQEGVCHCLLAYASDSKPKIDTLWLVRLLLALI